MLIPNLNLLRGRRELHFNFLGVCSGELILPSADDMTPELGVLVFNKGAEEQLEVDLLQDLFKVSRQKIYKDRRRIRDKNIGSESFFVLSEWAVLLNRVNNTVGLSKYQRPEALIQVRNAFAIYHAHILKLLDAEEIKKAQSGCNKLIRLAKSSQLGIELFLKHGLDLLDAIPAADPRFEAVFEEKALVPGMQQVRDKRLRTQRARDQRLAEMNKK